MRFFVLFLTLLISAPMYSQTIPLSVVASSGGYTETGVLSLSWTVGESLTESFEQGSVTLSQGFQQGVRVLILQLPRLLTTESGFSVFPNPATSFLTIHSEIPRSFSYILFSVSGEQILQGSSPTTPLHLDISGVTPGSYLLVMTTSAGIRRSIVVQKIVR